MGSLLILAKAAPQHHIHSLRTPSAAEIRAGNYKMMHVKVQGLDITIENPRGSLREGVDDGGNKWRTGMVHHYGYIKKTLGVDGDHVDCFLGPNHAAPTVFVITTSRPPSFRKVDEQKCMIGFNTESEARSAFQMHYDDPRFLRSLVAMPMAEFKAKVLATRTAPVLMKALLVLHGSKSP